MNMIQINNPVIWADVPDNDVIREGNAFYMVSTSMHSMPGGPIMKSYDLQHWEQVSYIFDRLAEKEGNNLENGKHIYGKGSWASSLKKIGDKFYCLLNSNDDGHAYMFITDDIEKSGWEKYPLDAYLHDPALLEDDDGRIYVIYGNGEICIVELEADLKSVKKSVQPRLLLSTEREGIMLRAEGCHAFKKDGMYYLIFIEWPLAGNRRRREVCYRSKSLEGPFEHRVILDDDMNYHNSGVAQGAIFTLPDSRNWAAVMFQDHGAVGRIPYVLPVTWEDGWPMPGIDGKVPERFVLPLEPASDKEPERYCLSCSDDFARLPGHERELADVRHRWQWNHNPDDALWSIRDKALKLVNGHLTDTVLQARNTLTQRTYGPGCECSVLLDYGGLKAGDRAGIMGIQGLFGLIGVRAGENGTGSLVMCVNDGNGGEKVVEELPLAEIIETEGSTQIYLKICFEFEDNRDKATFFWSTDGIIWGYLGEELQMKYTLDHFMGYRVGLYSYPTEETGGFAMFKDFRFTTDSYEEI